MNGDLPRPYDSINAIDFFFAASMALFSCAEKWKPRQTGLLFLDFKWPCKGLLVLFIFYICDENIF